jgi:hypothetical protein
MLLALRAGFVNQISLHIVVVTQIKETPSFSTHLFLERRSLLPAGTSSVRSLEHTRFIPLRTQRVADLLAMTVSMYMPLVLAVLISLDQRRRHVPPRVGSNMKDRRGDQRGG